MMPRHAPHVRSAFPRIIIHCKQGKEGNRVDHCGGNNIRNPFYSLRRSARRHTSSRQISVQKHTTIYTWRKLAQSECRINQRRNIGHGTTVLINRALVLDTIFLGQGQALLRSRSENRSSRDQGSSRVKLETKSGLV